MRYVLLSCLAGILTGCGDVPLASLPALRAMNPLTLDPLAARIAVDIPAVIRPDPQGQSLTLIVTREGRPDQTYGLALQPVPASPLAPAPGRSVHAFGLTPRAQGQARELQAEISRSKANGVKGTVQLSVDGKACAQGPLPQGPVRFDLYVRLDDGGVWIQALKASDARGLLEPGQTLEERIPPCQGASTK
jgi:hypothetical protein